MGNPEPTVRDFDGFALAAWPRLRWSGVMLTGDDHLARERRRARARSTYAAWETWSAAHGPVLHRPGRCEVR